MHLSFHSLALTTSILFSLLSVVWMFAPTKLLSAWNVDYTASTGLVGRRAAALYLGFVVMFFIARNAEPSIIRTALIYGLITTCLMLALLGLYELFKGRASKGILSAVFIEITLSLLFLLVWLFSALLNQGCAWYITDCRSHALLRSYTANYYEATLPQIAILTSDLKIK